MKPLLAAIAIPVALLLAAPAHADGDSFYKYIDDHGILRYEFPGGLLATGLQMCQMLHAGQTPEQVRAMGGLAIMDTAGVLDAAQHELCPDTLKAGG